MVAGTERLACRLGGKGWGSRRAGDARPQPGRGTWAKRDEVGGKGSAGAGVEDVASDSGPPMSLIKLVKQAGWEDAVLMLEIPALLSRGRAIPAFEESKSWCSCRGVPSKLQTATSQLTSGCVRVCGMSIEFRTNS